MLRHCLLATLLVTGCGRLTATVPTTAESPDSVFPSAEPYDEVAASPLGLYVESSMMEPRLDANGNRIGNIGVYTVSPGQGFHLVARSDDGSPVTSRIIPNPEEPGIATMDSSGLITVLTPGRFSVAVSSPRNDRIAWISFASVDPALADSRVDLPEGTMLAGPQPQSVDEFSRGAKAFVVTTDEEWTICWQESLRFPLGTTPPRPAIDFTREMVLVFRYYRQPHERDPVVTRVVDRDGAPTVELVVPTKRNWRVTDPVTGPDLPAHVVMYRLPRLDLQVARLQLRTSRMGSNRPIPRYSREEASRESPRGPGVPVL